MRTDEDKFHEILNGLITEEKEFNRRSARRLARILGVDYDRFMEENPRYNDYFTNQKAIPRMLQKKISAVKRNHNSVHQRIIRALARRIRRFDRFSAVDANKAYHNKTDDERGEIDVLAFSGFYGERKRKSIYVFEVKQHGGERSKKQVRKQLTKAKRQIRVFYGDDVNLFLFYVHGSNNTFRVTPTRYPYHIERVKDLEEKVI